MGTVLFGDHGSRTSSKQIGWTGSIVLVAAFGLWAAVYVSGVWPWLGYASASRSSFGIGPVGVVGEDSAGGSYGLSDFLFIEGQEIVIEYDADIRSGSLSFHVFRPFDGVFGDGVMYYVTESSAGAWTWRVPETAIYTVLIEPSVVRGAGRGYDMRYSACWGARKAS